MLLSLNIAAANVDIFVQKQNNTDYSYLSDFDILVYMITVKNLSWFISTSYPDLSRLSWHHDLSQSYHDLSQTYHNYWFNWYICLQMCLNTPKLITISADYHNITWLLLLVIIFSGKNCMMLITAKKISWLTGQTSSLVMMYGML